MPFPYSTRDSKSRRIGCKAKSVRSKIKVDRENLDEVFSERSKVFTERRLYNFVSSSVWNGTPCGSVAFSRIKGHPRVDEDLENCEIVLQRDNPDWCFQA